MRRSLVILWLLLGMVPSIYGATSTLTGTLKDAQGNPINGRLTMQLPVPAVDTATNTNVPATLVSFSILNGAIQSGPSLYDVAGLSPANLYYITKVYDSANNLIETGYFVVTGATFNLGAAVPTTVTTSNISYVAPAQAGTCPANQFITAVSATGAPSCAQPSAANLSNGVTGGGAIVLATNPTVTTGTFTIKEPVALGGPAIIKYNAQNSQSGANLTVTLLSSAQTRQASLYSLQLELVQSTATLGCTTQPSFTISGGWTESSDAVAVTPTIPLAGLGSATYSTAAQSFAATLSASTIWVSMPILFQGTASTAVTLTVTYSAGVGCSTPAGYLLVPILLELS